LLDVRQEIPGSRDVGMTNRRVDARDPHARDVDPQVSLPDILDHDLRVVLRTIPLYL
jgi:hypothetical protein